jgi:chromosomal replication initiation ATPase DnaA
MGALGHFVFDEGKMLAGIHGYIAEQRVETVSTLKRRIATLEAELATTTRLLNEERALAGKPTIAAAAAARRNPVAIRPTTGEDDLARALCAAVAKEYGVDVDDVIEESHRSLFVRPRHVAMYVLREGMGWSHERVGNLFSFRHHTTAIHACRVMEAKRVRDVDLDEQLSRFINELKARKPRREW